MDNINTCIITGGCGFIGRNFTKKLISMGKRVVIIDNMSSESSLLPNKWIQPNNNVIYINKDLISFLNDNQDYKCDMIIHAAAIVGGRYMIENDPFIIASNINLDNCLFNWIKNHKYPPQHLIYFSSSAVYPISLQTENNFRKLKLDDIDIERDQIKIPDLTYGWSKLTGEFLAHCLIKKSPIKISIYRPFSGYGEDQHISYPFPKFLSTIKKIKEDNFVQDTIEIWNDSVRDFVHVNDIVNYVMNTFIHDEQIITLNIGTGISTSMSELINILSLKILGKKLKIKVLEDKPKGVYYRVCEDNEYQWLKLQELNI